MRTMKDTATDQYKAHKKALKAKMKPGPKMNRKAVKRAMKLMGLNK